MPLPLAGFLVGTAFGRFLQVVIMATVGKVLIGLGISIVTFTGITIGINALKTAYLSTLTGITGTALTFMQMGGFLNAVNMMIASMVAVTAIKTVTGTIKQIRLS